MRRKKDKPRRREQHPTPPPVITAETIREQRAAGLLSRVTTLPLQPPAPIVTSPPPPTRASSGFVVEERRSGPAQQAPVIPESTGPSAAAPPAPLAPLAPRAAPIPHAPQFAATTPRRSAPDQPAGGDAVPPVPDLEATTVRPRHYGLRLPDESVVPVTRRAIVVGRRTDRPLPVPTDADVVALDDAGRSLSRHHVSIAIGADAAVWVTDLGSGNGTTLVSPSGEVTELEAHTPARARVGSLLSIGDHSVTVVRHRPESDTTAALLPSRTHDTTSRENAKGG
ncbi:FHA domain-containing protein [Frigoribacterium sp. SL97]|uniref:FHA domain-containing protein n=1 Tax=Frigoribacterium sp. SL97 TaxID=2994664 RepID=UPI0012F93BD8|nr:FHA domain-containing protein [Frigoribacterium sp. SL97]WAC52452.1 FHA domain-containing protein [Frigoribacterium sp. SL97]